MSSGPGDYHFPLPSRLIAQQPLTRRDQARMMVLQRGKEGWDHGQFTQLPDLLPPGTLLVVNNTRVLPARLAGRLPNGRQVEALLLEESTPGRWEAMVKGARRLKPGMEIPFLGGRLLAQAESRGPEGTWFLVFQNPGQVRPVLESHGYPPLPPYIRRVVEDVPSPETTAQAEADRKAYQTVFARQAGAVAAPTAGLHFTPQVLGQLEQAGIERVEVTLHVGAGTFQPIRAEQLDDHTMHREWYQVGEEASHRILAARREGRPVVAVGTTAVRALESWGGKDERQQGWTTLFIRPPFKFQLTDGLLTNFHLPGSTLLMLVAAFHGQERLLAAYHEAVEKEYRFFSYGDCMLILPPSRL
ncbi:MAG: tRNA preQ1(34) S-adenosylmethionine ribosyltransferase-isomerase QueA [Deltaproteobacteria bacterium]|nr:tRNA preQ1(34) S-adenosylmethionine ribosyltransferase-isomerase QueA [Deltaproteobacteria bacterium]